MDGKITMSTYKTAGEYADAGVNPFGYDSDIDTFGDDL